MIQRIRRFLAVGWWDDYVFEWIPDPRAGGRLERAVDWVQDHVADPVIRLLCRIYGHEVVPDHCGIPEHWYCINCRETVGR